MAVTFDEIAEGSQWKNRTVSSNSWYFWEVFHLLWASLEFLIKWRRIDKYNPQGKA